MVAALLFLAGCAGDVAVGVPWLEAPAAVELDDAIEGRPTSWAVAVTNTGTGEARVSISASSPFEVPDITAILVPEGATGELPVRLVASGYAPVTGTLHASTGFQDLDIELTAWVAIDADSDGHLAVGAGGDDCDDDDPEVHPEAVEVCNGADDDCSGAVDDLDPLPAWFPDADGDGHGDAAAAPTEGCDRPAGHVATATDCDDTDPATHPDAVETFYDGTDQDCDGLSDFDRDRDGYDSAAHGGSDCQDDDATVHPGVPEVWYDGIDQDCDGNDDDQDGDGSPLAADCDDLDASVSPDAPELDDGLDQDCDGWIDEDFLVRGSLVLTEIMADPVAVAPNAGRYLELHNPTDGHVDLAGLEATLGPQVTLLPVQLLAPGGVALLCVETDPALNGGLTCDGPLGWPGGTGRITVSDGGSLVVDEVVLQGWSVPSGASLELASDQLDPDLNDVEAAWCPAQVDLGSGDLGTPGTITPPCP